MTSSFASPELDVGAVEIIQEADNTEALIELEMVIVVELRRGEEGQMVAGVGVDSGGEREGVPGPSRHQVATQEQGAQRHREQVGERVLEGVRVERGEPQGRAPLVVDLVHAPVEGGAVQGQVSVEEAHLLHQHEHGQLRDHLQS